MGPSRSVALRDSVTQQVLVRCRCLGPEALHLQGQSEQSSVPVLGLAEALVAWKSDGRETEACTGCVLYGKASRWVMEGQSVGWGRAFPQGGSLGSPGERRGAS